MGKKEILDNPCFRYTDIVSDNAQEYFKGMELHFFVHFSVYPNGKYWFLCTSHDWPKAILAEKKMPPIGFTIYDQITDKILFPNMDKGDAFGWENDIAIESKERFGIIHPMMITRKYNDHYEVFLFDLHCENVCEKYVNYFNTFENFIHYHKDKSKKLIEKIKKSPLIVDSKFLMLNNDLVKHFSVKENTLTAVQPKRYYLRHQCEDISISAKEHHCLQLLSHGYQFRSIAQNMGVSPRTIETYFDRIKKKLNLNHREDIVAVYWNSRFCPTK